MNIKKEKKYENVVVVTYVHLSMSQYTHKEKKKTEKRNSQKIKYNKVNEK